MKKRFADKLHESIKNTHFKQKSPGGSVLLSAELELSGQKNYIPLGDKNTVDYHKPGTAYQRSASIS